jgi:hypothetical protein
MIFCTPPPDGPARRAWSIASVLLGEVLEPDLPAGVQRNDGRLVGNVASAGQSMRKEYPAVTEAGGTEVSK